MKWSGRFKQNSSTDPMKLVMAMQPEQYVILNRRQYLKHVPYFLPVDEQECNRLDFEHHMMRYILRGNYVVSLQSPARMLDIGCGTGRWIIEMAQEFPEARVYGVDLQSPASDPHAIPANCQFVRSNILNALPFQNDFFDFVHLRSLMWAIPVGGWSNLADEIRRVVAPAGTVQFVEFGDVLYGGLSLGILRSLLADLARQRGIDMQERSKILSLLHARGFVSAKERFVHLPMGRTAGRVGAMVEANLLSTFESLRGIIVDSGLSSVIYYDQLLSQTRREIEAARGKCTCTVQIVTATVPPER